MTVFVVMATMLVINRLLMGRMSDVANAAYVISDDDRNNAILTDYPECPRALLTLITSFKPTMDKVDIYRRTIDNWSRLRPFVQPILFKVAHEEASEELLNEARNAGWIIEDVPELGVNSSLPVFKSLFLRAMKVSGRL